MTTTGSLAEARYELLGNFEVLALADGSLFVDDLYGNHRRVADPPRAVRLALLDLPERSIDEVLDLHAADHDDRTTLRRQLESVASHLESSGLIRRKTRDAATSTRGRFAKQDSWFLAQNPDLAGFECTLNQASVGLLGIGGAGSVAAICLAAAGIGGLNLIDGDVVELSNLTRQVFYSEHDAESDTPKVDALARRITELNSGVEIRTIDRHVSDVEEIAEVIADVDMAILTADAPRFLLHRRFDEACRRTGTAYVAGFVSHIGPMYRPGRPGCWRCVEAQMRSQLPYHDLVVDALAAKTEWDYPSFFAGPVATGALLAGEAVRHLSGIVEPKTAGASYRLRGEERFIEPFAPEFHCQECRDYTA